MNEGAGGTNKANIADLKDGETTALARSVRQQIEGLLTKARGIIQQSVPPGVDPSRYVRNAITVIQRSPQILECYAPSISGAIVVAASLGLECNTIRGEAYLVPFYNTKKRRMEVQLIPGYRGLIDLARRAGLKSVEAFVVYQRDRFECQLGLEPKLVHEPYLDSDPGEHRLAYAIARWPDGAWQFDMMPAWQVLAIKARTKSRNKDGKIVGPWVSDEDEMWKKTVVRRLAKYLPMSPELGRALSLQDRASSGDGQNLEAALEGDFSIDEGEENMEGSGTQDESDAKHDPSAPLGSDRRQERRGPEDKPAVDKPADPQGKPVDESPKTQGGASDGATGGDQVTLTVRKGRRAVKDIE